MMIIVADDLTTCEAAAMYHLSADTRRPHSNLGLCNLGDDSG
jgi:hypothetical protein